MAKSVYVITYKVLFGLFSFITVAMNSSDQFEIIGLYKILLSIKQLCSSVCLKKHEKLINLIEIRDY